MKIGSSYLGAYYFIGYSTFFGYSFGTGSSSGITILFYALRLKRVNLGPTEGFYSSFVYGAGAGIYNFGGES